MSVHLYIVQIHGSYFIVYCGGPEERNKVENVEAPGMSYVNEVCGDSISAWILIRLMILKAYNPF